MTLREWRLNAGLRQIDAAKKLRVDQTAISNWEVGRRGLSDKYAKKLAKLYGCTVGDFAKES